MSGFEVLFVDVFRHVGVSSLSSHLKKRIDERGQCSGFPQNYYCSQDEQDNDERNEPELFPQFQKKQQFHNDLNFCHHILLPLVKLKFLFPDAIPGKLLLFFVKDIILKHQIIHIGAHEAFVSVKRRAYNRLSPDVE